MRTRAELGTTVDHGVIVGSSLERLTDAFEAAGLDPVYAGPLANGVNHLSQVAFPDGSYFELLSTIEPDQASPWWDDHMKRDGGPCAWALESGDIESAAERAAAAGLAVDGPTQYGRERPDGTYFDYDLAIVGEDGVATTFPFLIQDHTPRRNRVQWPSPCTDGTAVTGIRYVVIAVSDLDDRGATYRQAYGLDDPLRYPASALDAELLTFPDSPVVLVSPTSDDSWLAERLAVHGERPAVYLLGTTDLEKTVDTFDLSSGDAILGHPCAWFDTLALTDINTRLGVVGETSSS